MPLFFPLFPSFSRMLPYSNSRPTSTSTLHIDTTLTLQRLFRVLEPKGGPSDAIPDQLCPSSLHRILTKRKRNHPNHRLLQRHRNGRLLRFPSLLRKADQRRRRHQQRLLGLLRRRNLADNSYLVTPPRAYTSPPRSPAHSPPHSLAAPLRETPAASPPFRASPCSFGDSRSGGSEVAYSSEGRRYTYLWVKLPRNLHLLMLVPRGSVSGVRELVELVLPRGHFFLGETVLFGRQVVQVETVGVAAFLSADERETVLRRAVACSALKGDSSTTSAGDDSR